MPAPREYSIEAPSRNIRDLVPDARAGWSLAARLAAARDGNGNHKTGRWSRARSRREHELDEYSALLRACDQQGTVIVLGCWRRKGGAGAAHVRSQKCGRRCTGSAVHPWAILHDRAGAQSAAIADGRRKLTALRTWCAANDPVRAGWALAQSAPRAQRDPRATHHYLPRASWPAFIVWRQAAAAVAWWLLFLWAWWDRLIPLPRGATTRPEASKRPRATESASEAGAWYRDQSARGGAPVPLRALLSRVT